MDREEALRMLLVESERYLCGLASIQAVKIGQSIAILGHRPVADAKAQPDPACGHLDETLAAVNGADALVAAIEAARLHLRWIAYDGYPRAEIGPRFPTAHAFATLMRTEDFELGLFLIAPRTLYRDHHHAAAELYAPLTGPHRWRFGIGERWQELPAHRPVWNEPWAVHATAVGATPLLCLYAWEHDIDMPAKVVHADDWNEIEASLEGQAN